MVRILVRHPDGREYAVTPDAVARYKALGFEAIGPEVPEPAKPPKRRKR